MVIDTSALIAILEQEPLAEAIATAIEEDSSRLLSAASLLEAAIVMTARRGAAAGRELDLLIHKARIEVLAVTPEQIDLGRDAFVTYGKGRHPAGLNFGDCFVFALAAQRGEPILCTGNDFPKTGAAIVAL